MNWKAIVYPVLVIGIGGGVGSWMMSNPSSSFAFAQGGADADPLADAPTVATISPFRGNYAPQLQLYSQLQSGQQILVNSPAAADVVNVLVFEGDRVNEGDVLVELDTTQLQRQVQQLNARRMDLEARQLAEQAQYQNNVAALEVEEQLVDIAERSVTRVTRLSKDGLSSAADLENAERTLQTQLLSLQNRRLAIAQFDLVNRQFEAQLMELDSQIDQAQEQLAEATVTAPFTAEVSQVQVQIGASLNSGQNLMTLVDPAQQELVAWVSANALDTAGDYSTLKGQLEQGETMLPVQLTHADPSANAGSLRLFFETDSAENDLILNRYYRMWIDLPTQSAYAVPEASVYSNNYVYKIEENALVRVTVDVVGERFEEGQIWRLVQGPLDGASVLVTRLQSATQGLAVRTAQDTQTLATAE